MSDVLTVVIPGKCPGKGSKRAVMTGGVNKPRRALLIDADPEAVSDWRGDALRLMAERAPETPIDAAVEVRVWIYHRRPLSHYRGGKREKGLRGDAPRWASSMRPDGDKVLRAVWDCLTQARWIRDDVRVSSFSGTKEYCDDDRACTIVSVWRLEEVRS